MIPQKLRDVDKWCVSKNKMPLDMYALARGLEWGASTKRSHPCYASYETAVEMSRVQNLPITLYLDSAETGYYIIDIEPICPAKLRQQILLALHDYIEYLERSLSGKGYHMIVRMDAPEALTTVKHKKWVEILSNHHCTFTLKEIDFQTAYYDQIPDNQAIALWDADVNPDDMDAKRDHEILQALSAPLTPRAFYDIIGAGHTKIVTTASEPAEYKAALSTFDDRHADLFNGLCDMIYEKTLEDFNGDQSRWEFGYASKMHYHLQRMSRDMVDSKMNHYQTDLNQAQAVMLVYMALRHMLPPREKHKNIRNGLPWLLYTSQQVYIKTFGPADETEK